MKPTYKELEAKIASPEKELEEVRKGVSGLLSQLLTAQVQGERLRSALAEINIVIAHNGLFLTTNRPTIFECQDIALEALKDIPSSSILEVVREFILAARELAHTEPNFDVLQDSYCKRRQEFFTALKKLQEIV